MKFTAIMMILLVGALLVAGCDSSANDSSNYDYVPVQGNGCGVAGPEVVPAVMQSLPVEATSFSV